MQEDKEAAMDPKEREALQNKKESEKVKLEGNEAYKKKEFEKALELY